MNAGQAQAFNKEAGIRATAWILWVAARVVRRPARWASRRFTTPGAMLAAGTVVALGTANPAQTMGMPAFTVLAGLLVLALLQVPWFRPRLRVVRRVPAVAACNEPFVIDLAVTNLGRRGEAGLTCGEDLAAPAPSRSEVEGWLRDGAAPHPLSAPAPVPAIAPGATETVRLTVTPRRRGVLRLARVLVSRPDACGLVRAFARVPVVDTVLVLPRRYPLPPPVLPGASRLQPGGVALASGIGEAEEFAALRDYRRGDPPRRIHWRSSARTGELVVKECHDEQIVRHALLLDADMGSAAAFEDGVAVAASFACTIPDQEALLDLLFIGREAVHLVSGRGVGHALPMLEALAVAERRPGSFAGLAELALAHARPLSGCLLVLDAYDAPRRALVARLRRQDVAVVVLLLVPPGARGEPAIADPAERPDRLLLLERGRIAEDLAAVGALS